MVTSYGIVTHLRSRPIWLRSKHTYQLTDSDLVVTAGPLLEHPTPTIEKDRLTSTLFIAPQ
jgi:hypothetical protein